MQISMYRASVPVLARAMKNLIHVLELGAKHAEDKKLDPSVLPNYRLAPDMFPLSRQVMIVTDMSKGCVARLAGVEIPSYADTEETIPDLIARLKKCIAFVEGFTPSQLDGTELNPVTLQRKTGDLTYPGLQYLLEYVQPHVYFHCVTAYGILRHCGVPVGKQDFIGKL